jgi:hypothetical protein
MKVPLIEISVPSIYMRNGVRQLLPTRMARCTPDMHAAIMSIADDLDLRGGKLYLSDLFRSHDMQLQAHLDWKSGKKSAFSPPPGSSMHEAGRALDLDLSALAIPLAQFWPLAASRGLSPIVNKPDSRLSEAWHFDCRGSHARVHDYYRLGKGKNFSSPAAAMAASAINAVGVVLDAFGSRQREASIQFGLVRLGFELGSVDGNIGKLTRDALAQAGVPFSDLDTTLEDVENLVQLKYPAEYEIPAHLDLAGQSDVMTPKHVVA